MVDRLFISRDGNSSSPVSIEITYRLLQLRGNINLTTGLSDKAVRCEENLRFYTSTHKLPYNELCNYQDTKQFSMFKQTMKFDENLLMLYTKCHRHPGGKIWLSFKSSMSLAINCTHKEYVDHTEDICVPKYMEPKELSAHYVGLPIIPVRKDHTSIKDVSTTTSTFPTSTTTTTILIILTIVATSGYIFL